MNSTRYLCCDEHRLEDVRAHPTLTGIEYLEVVDDPTLPNADRQRTLLVHLVADGGQAFPVKDGYAGLLKPANVVVLGGERIRDVGVAGVTVDPARPRVLIVTVDRAGDFSPYTLRVVRSHENHARLDNFDPILSAVEFSFKVECPNEFDCEPRHDCPPPFTPEPDIDYLAKDYASFRRLMLDRMSTLAPSWTERSAADLGVTLVELLAYVADRLSYEQDAIATEAYLGTCRRRVSARRHARLLDYAMHDGCNARAWVQVEVSSDTVLERIDLAGTRTRFLTAGGPDRHVDAVALSRVLEEFRPEVFEPLETVPLFAAHNEIAFYTWGATDCCLPKGATRAALRDDVNARLRLRPGDVLIFEEQIGPHTGDPADADPASRHAVRLTAVTPEASIVMKDGAPVRVASPALVDPLTGQPVVEIEWGAADALPFPLCVSATTDKEHGERPVDAVSVALGNNVLADHGLTILSPEPIGEVVPSVIAVASGAAQHCESPERIEVPPRFNPILAQRPLTQAVPYDSGAPGAAADAVRFDPAAAVPAIELTSDLDGVPADWTAARDLLNAHFDTTAFVVEIETDGSATLRFGDDEYGMRPQAGTAFEARYRVGNGSGGNVGRDVLSHFVSGDPAIVSVRNPMAAAGGVDGESIESVRQLAPSAFRTQRRAVTAADYAEVAGRHAGVQRAAATFRWTGSWRTVFVSADRLGGLDVDEAFEDSLVEHLEPYRMAGQDVEIDAARSVPLAITMAVCAKPDYFRSDVKAALLDVFSTRRLPDGRLGVFHPDNFTFGQPLYLSRLYAIAQAVDGVESVQVTQFERLGQPATQGLSAGKLTAARREVLRLDNDRNFPERGVFRVLMQGGK
jgi:hypothetical protein